MTDVSRPQVVLDIATLGYVQDEKAGARGIHRVVQMLFQGLLESDSCDLRFVASSHLAGAIEMLRDKRLSPDEVLRFHRRQLPLSRLGRSGVEWVHRNMDVPGRTARLRRRLVSTCAEFFLSGERRISPRFLDGCDIYHSPLAPIPESVHRHPKIRPFLTIHDLLALSLPQVLGPDTVRPAENLVRSVSPDSFVFAVSEHVKADVLRFTGLDPNRVFVTPLAADQNIFFPVTEPEKIAAVRRKYSIPDAPYFLTLSAFDPRKNFGHIVRCFGELFRAGETGNASLVIVGANPHRSGIVEEACVQNPGIREQVIMPGFVPDEDLAALYSGALAFLFPSLGEGFGLPVLEAMQCGTPVLSSNATSLPEVVGDAGILLDPQDQAGWCQAMISLRNDPALRQTLRTQGLERARLFTWSLFIERTLAGYRTAVGRTAG